MNNILAGHCSFLISEQHPMSEFERIIELLEKILKNQQTALDRSDCDQSALCSNDVKSSPENDNPRNWLSPEETMKILGVCVRTLYTLRINKTLTCTRIGNQYRYFAPDLFKIRNFHLK
jgi:hypothetical protein